MGKWIRKSRVITNKEDLDFIFNTTPRDCAKLSFMMEMFGDFDGKRRFNPYDIIEVPPGVYGPPGMKNKNSFTTTIGIFVFNREFLEEHLVPLIGYINEPITKKMFKKINQKLSYAVIEDKIPLDVLKYFIIRTQKNQAYVDILAPSFTSTLLELGGDIDKKKKELLKKYEKGIEEKNPAEIQKLEKELLAFADEKLKDDPSQDMINSGGGADKGNNFKNIFTIRGAIKNTDPHKGNYDVLLGNYLDGFKADEYKRLADSVVGGPYARAKKTAYGGYLEKMFVKSFEHLKVLEPGSDCGTKRTIEVFMDDNNLEGWIYSYIVEGNKLIELTSENKDKYKGKKVRIRYSGLCEAKDGICNKCAGNLFTRIGITNVGIASYAIASKVKLISMKSFHDSQIYVTNALDYGLDKIFN